MTQPAFDVHQHLWPEALVSALSRRREPPRIRRSILHLEGAPESDAHLGEHRLETRLRRLDADGTDIALLSLQPTLGLAGLAPDEEQELADAYHDGVLELVAASGGRLRALAHAEARDGFDGATIAASTLVRALHGDEELPLLGALEHAGQILFVHPGAAPQPDGAPPWWSEVVAYTAEMQAAYVAWTTCGTRRYPLLRVVFALLAGGAALQLERLASRDVDIRTGTASNVFLDTASYGRRGLETALETLGVGQLVFGSDAPVLEASSTLRAVAGFGDAVADLVRRENPSLLLR